MSDYFDRIEHQLVARVEQAAAAAAPGPDRRRSRRPGRRALSILGPLGAVAVVAAVIAVILISGGRAHQPGSASRLSVHRHVSLTLRAPAATAPATMAHAATTVRARMRALAVPGHVAVHGHSLVISNVPGRDAAQVALLGQPDRLRFYDWEADVLLPSGHPDASRLLGGHDATALELSQGVNGTAPGSTPAGAVTLYRAVSLAARQPAAPRSHPRSGSRASATYLFGRAGSAACTTLARAQGAATAAAVTSGGHCLLAGPALTLAQLRAELPTGVTLADGHRLTVKPGTTLLAAAAPSTVAVSTASPAARFYVLRDRPELTGAGLTHVRAAKDSGGQPDVSFGFTPAAARAFQDMTATVAHRGASVSTGTTVDLQHFAIALDGRLLSVPAIDFKQYPDGVVQQGARAGAEITGGFTSGAARMLAAVLRGGALGVSLTPSAGG